MENITSNNNANFYWWFGVVEDRDDPLRMGRCRIRILGYHNDDTEILPSNELPWAIPIGPTTSAGTSGVGWSPTGPVNGSWVVGFFADGSDGQHPMFFGTVGSIPGGLGANGNCEPGSGPGNANDPTGTGQDNATDGGQPISGGPPNQEFWTLVAICACEAGVGAGNNRDQCDVAQVIYNRLLYRSDFHESSIVGIVTADQQFEPTWRRPSNGTSGKANPQWRNITDVNSAARCTGIAARSLMSVARNLKDASLQTAAKQFVGSRGFFLGRGQPGTSLRRKIVSQTNGQQFGDRYNYNGTNKGAANVPAVVTNYQLGDGSPQTTTTTTTPRPGA